MVTCSARRDPASGDESAPSIFETHDSCAVCGGVKDLEVHHIHPYHLQPTMELDSNNLITLCEHNHCHFAFGHLYDWHSWNPDVLRDSTTWRSKIRHRLQA